MATLKIFHFVFLISLSLFIFSCSNKKDEQRNEDTVAFQIEENSGATGVQKMQVSTNNTSVSWRGKNYKISINRAPSSSLPKVKATSGDIFWDNEINLTITGANGAKFFNKQFTKQSFSSIITPDFLSKSILEGLVFDKTTENALLFAASVSYPQTDLYIPVSITVSKDGKMSIKKEELIEEAYLEEEG